jgi:diguanylate cyclase (GGDEF)-like protein
VQIYRKPPQLPPLESAFFKLPDTLLMILDAAWTVQLVSEGWRQVLDLRQDELRWRPFVELVHDGDQQDTIARLASLDDKLATVRFSCRLRCRDGRYIGLTWNVSHDRNENLYYASAHETAVSLSDTSASLPEVYVDGLTGLPNRSLFIDRIEHTLQRLRRRKDARFAVLYCGIDRFKVINHSLGNRLGDMLLVAVANLLRSTTRPTDMVARLGGDEFGILLEDIQDASSPVRVVKRIQELLFLPFPLHEHEVFATASFGITVSGDEYSEPDHMVRDANMAMVRAKNQGGGSYVVFNPGMHDEAVRRLELEMDLRRALERSQFQAYYQPIVALQSGRLAGFEALVRWAHPDKGLISPAEFIPVAEQTGLIVPLGQWMLDEACRQMRTWQLRYPRRPALTVSVNLSARQLLRPELPREIRRTLRESGLSPRHLKLEITESAMMEDAERAIELLVRLRRMRVRLLLDDFGTGYSSLSYLHRLPIDTLKIDRSFVMHLHENAADKSFVETIVQLARQLGRDVVCEGVEQPAQEAILKALKVKYSQGYLYSRPVTANEAEMLIITDRERFALDGAAPVAAAAHPSPADIAT